LNREGAKDAKTEREEEKEARLFSIIPIPDELFAFIPVVA